MNNKTIHQWKNIQLVEKPVTLPTGKTIIHTTILHPGAAVILPMLANGEIVLVRQFRPSLNKWLLELPAGTIDPGEDPLSCAQRELEEETGYRAQHMQAIGQCTPMAGFCDEIQHFFIAQQLSSPKQLALDEDEVIQVISLSLTEIEQAICQDELTDAKTIACISKAKLLGYITAS